MVRKVLLFAVIWSLTSTGLTAGAAVSANVTVAASSGASGTTTLTYRSTVTRAGVVRDIVMAIPPGSTGKITSVNGVVTTVSPGFLRWRPSKTVSIGVGARFSIPLYGLRLPAGGSWRLGFNATGTTGAVLSAGYGTLVIFPPAVKIVATNPMPGQKTTLSYSGAVAVAGTLIAVRMQMPAGASGAVTSINGTLTTSGGYATWKPWAPLAVGAGARLSIPINGLVLPMQGGALPLTMSASASTGSALMSGSGTLTLIAPPAAMPAVPVESMPTVRAGCPSSWPTTTTENARPGTLDWVIPSSMDGALAAYLTQTSATCGDVVDLKVTSGAPVSIVVYRMGYYQGRGAREIWRMDDVPAVVQPDPVTGGTANGHDLRMTSAAAWSTTASIPVTATWVPGTYLVKVSGGGAASYAPLTVRDDSGTKHDLLIQQATATWEAYNKYGGVGFYSGLTTGSGRLTYDRPYGEGQGSGQFLPLEQGLVFWAESKGLDVTYWTNEDLDEFGGQLPDRAGTLFLPGHDEYYSLGMRAALSQAIANGVNVANLGANTAYRRITYTNDSRRAWDIDRYTAGYDSTIWRYLGDGYASQPLLGAEYVCAVLGNTLTTGTSWVFDGVPSGTALPGFVAGEIDYVQPDLYQQPGQAIAATSAGTCRTNGRTLPMHLTTYTSPSGARVLNGSTFAFGCFLVARCPSNWTVPTPSAASQQAVGTIVANISEWVSRGQIQVPNDTAIAKALAAVPKEALPFAQQP